MFINTTEYREVYSHSPNATAGGIFLLENSPAISARRPAMAWQLGEHEIHLLDDTHLSVDGGS